MPSINRPSNNDPSKVDGMRQLARDNQYSSVTKARAREMLRTIWGSKERLNNATNNRTELITLAERQEIAFGIVSLPGETFLDALMRVAEDRFDYDNADMETRRLHFANLKE